MHVLDEPMRAPELRPMHWLNLEQNGWNGPPTLSALRERVVLIDFWDYTCINCIHTLDYIKEWHRRYRHAGLVVLGIHTPEFAFAKDADLVEAAVRRFDLPYPVGIDSDYTTWKAYGNRYWPAKYLLDQNGCLRLYHFGEGDYEDMERWIQRLLHEIDPGHTFPEPMPPVRAIDAPGCLTLIPTPELHLGYERGEFGNREGHPPDQTVDYAPPPEHLMLDTVYLEGPWLNAPEYVETVSDRPARLHVEYRAAEVNLVLCPGDRPVTVRLFQDGQPLPPDRWGPDVELLDHNPAIHVDTARMYRLVRNGDFTHHRLVLETDRLGLRAYAFTFVTSVATDTALA